MNKGILSSKDDIKVEHLTLAQDEFIEWVLQNTKEDTEFRVYQTKHYTMVGIDIEEEEAED